MNRYVFLALGVLIIYLAMTGRLIRFIDVLRQPATLPSGGGGSSGAG